MSQCNEYVSYETVLTDDEILYFSHLIDQFKRKQINYKKLEEILAKQGITIEPILVDLSQKSLTLNDYARIKRRIDSKDYTFDDISKYVISSDRYKNVLFSLGYKAIELLAKDGVPEYQELLTVFLRTQPIQPTKPVPRIIINEEQVKNKSVIKIKLKEK